MPYARVPRHPARLTGRQVTVVDGELVIAVQERRLDDEEVAALGEGVHAFAQPRVHDEREPLSTPQLAHVVEGDPAEHALALDPPHVRPLIPCSASSSGSIRRPSGSTSR